VWPAEMRLAEARNNRSSRAIAKFCNTGIANLSLKLLGYDFYIAVDLPWPEKMLANPR